MSQHLPTNSSKPKTPMSFRITQAGLPPVIVGENSWEGCTGLVLEHTRAGKVECATVLLDDGPGVPSGLETYVYGNDWAPLRSPAAT